MNTIVDINFSYVVYFFVAVFALVGFYRGWWREGITTFFLAILTLMLVKPELAEGVVDFINNILKLVVGVAVARSSDAAEISAAASEANIAIDAEQYQVYIVALIVMVVLSYLLGKLVLGGYAITPLGRMLGALLGGLNGYLAISLVREYLLGRYLPGALETEIGAAGAAPSTMSIQVSEMPTFGITDGLWPWMIIVAGLVIAVVMLTSHWSIQGNKINAAPPPGYKS